MKQGENIKRLDNRFQLMGRRDIGRKADRRIVAQERGTHVDNGWPHYSHTTGLCICLDQCCNNDQGCKCKFCPCRIYQMDHSDILEGHTI